MSHNRIVTEYEGVKISKCGARFIHKKEAEYINEDEKKTIQKKTIKKTPIKKKLPEIETGDFASLEDNEEINGVSV